MSRRRLAAALALGGLPTLTVVALTEEPHRISSAPPSLLGSADGSGGGFSDDGATPWWPPLAAQLERLQQLAGSLWQGDTPEDGEQEGDAQSCLPTAVVPDHSSAARQDAAAMPHPPEQQQRTVQAHSRRRSGNGAAPAARALQAASGEVPAAQLALEFPEEVAKLRQLAQAELARLLAPPPPPPSNASTQRQQQQRGGRWRRRQPMAAQHDEESNQTVEATGLEQSSAMAAPARQPAAPTPATMEQPAALDAGSAADQAGPVAAPPPPLPARAAAGAAAGAQGAPAGAQDAAAVRAQAAPAAGMHQAGPATAAEALPELPPRFTDAELLRFGAMHGLLRAGSPEERQVALQRGAAAAARTALWLREHPFSSDAELERFAHLVSWQGTDELGNPILHISIGRAVTDCRGSAALAFSNAIITHIERSLSERLSDWSSAAPLPAPSAAAQGRGAPSSSSSRGSESTCADGHGTGGGSVGGGSGGELADAAGAAECQPGVMDSGSPYAGLRSTSACEGGRPGDTETVHSNSSPGVDDSGNSGGGGGGGSSAGATLPPAPAAVAPAARAEAAASSVAAGQPSTPLPAERVVVLMDCSGASTLTAARMSWVFQAVASTLSHHYPGRMQELVLLNLPVMLSWIVSGVKGLVHPDTRHKIRVAPAGTYAHAPAARLRSGGSQAQPEGSTQE